MKKLFSLFIILQVLCFCPIFAEEDLSEYNIIKKEPIKGLPLKEAWNSKLPNMKVNQIWSSWNSVYLQTDAENHSLYSVKKESGVVRWINPIGFAIDKLPAENKYGMFLIKENLLYCIDSTQGGLMSKMKFDYAVAGNVAVSQYSLFAYEWGKKLHMYKTVDGILPGWTNKINEELNKSGTPCVFLDQVYLPTADGILYCYDIIGDKKWQFINTSVFEDNEFYSRAIDSFALMMSKEKQGSNPDLKKIKEYRLKIEEFNEKIRLTETRKRGQFVSNPGFYGDSMYIGSTDGSIYAINKFSGGPIWEYKFGEPVIGEIIAIADQVLYFTPNSGVVSIERGKDDTQLKWKLKDATELLTATSTHLYFRTSNKEILCVDRKNGIEKWRWLIANHYEVIKDITSNSLFVLDRNNVEGKITLYALNETGNLPKMEDIELLPDVGYFYYKDLENKRLEKIKLELKNAEALKKAEDVKNNN